MKAKRKSLLALFFILFLTIISFTIEYAAAVALPFFLFIGEGLNRSYIRTGEFSLLRSITYAVKDIVPTLIGMSIIASIALIEQFLSSLYSIGSVPKFIVLASISILYVVTYPLYVSVLRWCVHKYPYTSAFRKFWGELKKNKKEVLIMYTIILFSVVLTAVPVIPLWLSVSFAAYVMEFSPSLYEWMIVKKKKQIQGSR